MAQKEIDFHDFITPYDWSYSHDTGLWYEDKLETVPQPNNPPEKGLNFQITYFNAFISDTDSFSGKEEIHEDNTQEDLLGYFKYLIGEDMLRTQKKELYDNISLEIALRSLKISKWNLVFVIITFFISLYGILR